MGTFETKLRGARKRLREAMEFASPDDAAALARSIAAIDKLIASVKPAPKVEA